MSENSPKGKIFKFDFLQKFFLQKFFQVLPSDDNIINERIKIYNKHLSDISNSFGNGMVKFVESRIFCNNDGKMKAKFRCENDGPTCLHLNDEGMKLLASRIKRTLRECNNLPLGHGLPGFHVLHSHGVTRDVEVAVEEGVTVVGVHHVWCQ